MRLVASIPFDDPKIRPEGAISPDGRQLVVDLPDGGTRHLWILDVETGKKRLLSGRDAVRGSLAWSPDGRRVAYVGAIASPGGDTRIEGLVVVDVLSGEEKLVIVPDQFDAVVGFEWTRDGLLDFRQLWSGSGWFTDRVRPDGSGRRRLPPLDWGHPALAVSPDSQTLVFIGEGCGAPRRRLSVQLRSLVTRETHCIATVEGASEPMRWTPDASRVYLLALALDSIRSLYELDVARRRIDRVPLGKGPVRGFTLTASGDVLVVQEGEATTDFLLRKSGSARPVPAITSPPAEPPPEADLAVSQVPPPLLDVARHAAESDARVARLWPDFWRTGQSFVLYLPESRTTLLVGDGHALPGFRAVSGDSVPSALRGRLYLGEGLQVPLSRFDLPVARVSQRVWDSLGNSVARERSLRHLYHVALTGTEDPALLAVEGLDRTAREFDSDGINVRELFHRSFATTKDPPGRSMGCPDPEPPLCGALVVLERRILLAALDAPPTRTPDLLRLYAAVRWSRGPEHSYAERRRGVAQGVATRAARMAAGGDLTRYLTDLRDSLRAGPVLPDPRGTSTPAGAVAGETLTLLLDRLGTAWRADVQGGESMIEAVIAASGFDSTRAISDLANAFRRFDSPELRDLTGSSIDTALSKRAAHRQARFFEPVLRTTWPDAPPVHFDFFTRLGRKTRPYPLIRVTAGGGDSLSLSPGWVIYPAAAAVEIRACGMHLRVRGRPVLIDRNHQLTPGLVRVSIYLPPDVHARIIATRPPPRTSWTSRDLERQPPLCRPGEPAGGGRTWDHRIRTAGFSLDLSGEVWDYRRANGTSISP